MGTGAKAIFPPLWSPGEAPSDETYSACSSSSTTRRMFVSGRLPWFVTVIW